MRLSTYLLFAGLLALAVAQPVAQEIESAQTTRTPADSLLDWQVDNLRAFARLYGYVRYFHPSDEASDIDWNRFALHGARGTLGAESRDDLRRRLEALFLPIAPTLQIYLDGEAPPPGHSLLTPADAADLELITWQHRGVGLGNRGPFNSIRLNRATEVVEGPGFGSIGQQVDATAIQGKEIRLVATVKTEVNAGDGQAQLWLRVDRPHQQRGFFSNMHDRPIQASDWQTYEIIGRVDDDATAIAFGGFLAGNGRAWFDDFQLHVRDDEATEWTPVPLVNAAFEEGAIGDPPAGWGTGAPGYEVVITQTDAWEGDRSVMIVSPNRVQPATPLFDGRPAAGEVVNRTIGRGLAAQIPLALYSRDGRTLRPDEAPATEPLEASLRAISQTQLNRTEDAAVRFASIIIAWNVFQHFYPYFDVVDVDWSDVLPSSFQRAAGARTTKEVLQALRWMVAQLDDGHGSVYHSIEQEQAGLPLLVDRVEGHVVIVVVADTAGEACFQRGDIVTALDGVPSAEVLRRSQHYIAGSPQWKEFRSLVEFGRGLRGSSIRVDLARSGGTVACDVSRTSVGPLSEARPPAIGPLREDVDYVDLSRAEPEAISTTAEDLAAARGIVFDLRGYPNGTHGVLQHLTTSPLQSAHWQVPQYIYPDQERLVGYDTTGRWTLPPQEPHFGGRIVFLTDARAISYAESVLGIVEHYEFGEIVGQPTAGANGNINPFTLPGRFRVNWTGMRVIKHDGSQHHLIGIRPTVPVERTLEGVRAGRDEFLDRALELIDAP